MKEKIEIKYIYASLVKCRKEDKSNYIRKIVDMKMTEKEKIDYLIYMMCDSYVDKKILKQSHDIYEDCIKNNNNIIGCFNKKYNEKLLFLYEIPICIYYVGNISYLNTDNNYIALVGSRVPTKYSKLVCIDITDRISKNNVIVSGLAKGIDVLSHEITLKNNGKIIAVIGSGISEKTFYPKENYMLLKKIIENDGLILSEYPPMTSATRYTFPNRNRIIAALADDVIIIQAKLVSGSMHTANFALELGKNIYVPTSQLYDETYSGSHRLFSDGAIPITDLEELYGMC